MHILSPVTLLDSAERETKLSSRTGSRTSDLWFSSQRLSLVVYAKFHYSLNILFCEPTENCEYKRKLYMYRATEFCTMLTFTSEAQRRTGLLSSNPTGVEIRHTANGAPMLHYRFNNMPILSDIS